MARHPTVPDWDDGGGGDSERERLFAEPVWARVEQLKLEEQPRLEEEQRRLEEELLEQQRQDAEYMALFGDTYPDMTYAEFYAEVESSAVAAAVERNDRRPLANLIDPHFPFNANEPRQRQIRTSLSEQTHLLAAKVIRGELKHKGGRPKKGAEKSSDTKSAKSAKVRRATAAAANSLPLLKEALRVAYPDQQLRKIAKRAKYMAGKKYGVGEWEINRHLRLPKKLRLPD
jgi:hypothetical protein